MTPASTLRTTSFASNGWMAAALTHWCRLAVLGIVLYDEEWTLHPLIHDHFVRFLDERHVMSCGAGELLQTRPKLEQQWLDRNWHQPLAFNEPYYQQLLQRGSVLFMRLRHNHRLPPDQFKMMQRVSVEGATCLSIVLNVLSTA